MTISSKSEIQYSKVKPTALLWDESFLWGIMAYKAVIACGLSCDLIRSEDVRRGRLRDYSLLFVPGGWASNKAKALGKDGVDAIKQFVYDGGAYLGFCGGAGLATREGLSLVPIARRPTKERVPSFSGRIGLITSSHPVWQDISQSVFHAWWPSQFVIEGSVTVLATYGAAMPDAFSSDINVGDAESGVSWPELERTYQINLDPKRLFGEPAVIEGAFGRGKVLLSLVHFDTPHDRDGAMVLRNLWNYLASGAEDRLRSLESVVQIGKTPKARLPIQNPELFTELESAVEELISLGRRNFLWFWRNPMLLQWRRGVRGLEYCTLFIMVREISAILRKQAAGCGARPPDQSVEWIRTRLLPFVAKAKLLLVRERFAMQNAPITYERCDDPEIQEIRNDLFSRSKSHGGLFKEILDDLDELLFGLLTGKKEETG